jgi:hypothetical protein
MLAPVRLSLTGDRSFEVGRLRLTDFEVPGLAIFNLSWEIAGQIVPICDPESWPSLGAAAQI